MKRLSAAVVFLMLTAGSAGAQSTRELRGVWITNVDSPVMFSDTAIARGMDYLASIGINVVFPVVWNNGYSLYPSAVMNARFARPIAPSFSGRDPLARIVIEAHRNGIEVMPWFEYGFSSSYSQNGGHIIGKYPQWASRNNDGALTVKNGFDWMSGVNPDVQDFLISLATEVADAYDIDGIQGDDRLPGLPVEGGYDSVTVALYKKEHAGAMPPSNYADPDWMTWRAGKLNAFFARLKDSIKARSADLVISSAPSIYPWGYENYLQDAKTWVESGIAENFIPQVYRYDIAAYTSTLRQQLAWMSPEKKNIFFSGVLAKVGSYVIDPAFLLQSIQANRDNGIAGETFFFYEALRANNNRNGDTLHAAFYRNEALLPYRNGRRYRPKAVIVNEDDPGAQKEGSWTTLAVPGYRGSVLSAPDTGASSIVYTIDVPKGAWYDLYAYHAPRTAKTTVSARYELLGANGDTVRTVLDQTAPGWQKLGTVYADSGARRMVRLTNANIGAGRTVSADAVMLMVNRRRSPSVDFTTSVEQPASDGAPTFYTLGQNFPNPFNPTTNVRFTIAHASHVKLDVRDVLGREVAMLVDRPMMPGNYSIAWNAAGVSSGVYFYRLTAGAHSETKKMIVQK